MTDSLTHTTETGDNLPEIGVSEISGAIKRAVEERFGRIRVRGEVGRVSRPRSGHVYLDLKDDRAVLAAVIWKGVAAKMRVPPEEGMEVVATGKITTFPGQSKYQMIIDSIAPAGVGALMAMLEKRKRALTAEGLFDEGRKRAIPFPPRVIGVVTSPSGAVIRDILHRLADRFPRHVLIWPVVVQGERCAAEVAAAIEGFNALPVGGAVPRPDLIIVARGGGSLEDLWGFNEEIVVRAAAGSAIPLISAVGHETDVTLIDCAADRRAPTPTAAAEMAVPVRDELLAALSGLQERRIRALSRMMEERRARLRDLGRAMPRADALLAERRQRLDGASGRLPLALRALANVKRIDLSRVAARIAPAALAERINGVRERMEIYGARLSPGLARRAREERQRLDGARLPLGALSERAARARADVEALERRFIRAAQIAIRANCNRLDKLGRLLETLSYKGTLERGYAVVRGPDGATAARAAAVAPGAAVEIEFADGRLAAVTAPRASRPAPRAKGGGADTQGSLF